MAQETVEAIRQAELAAERAEKEAVRAAKELVETAHQNADRTALAALADTLAQ